MKSMLVILLVLVSVSCASVNIKTKQGITIETDKGSLTCIYDIDKEGVKTTCSGKIIISEKAYYECRKINVDALLKKEINIESDCELFIL